MPAKPTSRRYTALSFPLADAFDQWRRGELDSFDLSDRIHAFHQGSSRELYKDFVMAPPDAAVAYAINTGILDPDTLPPALLEALRSWLGFYKAQETVK